ncbi:MAG TPA: hypothetical protein PKE69_26795 [Pyrinomonadaceae bacterium]|nr:hypothetical protein [Pyrinomonadaceae bacterium]
MSIILKPETETLLINRAAAKGYNIDDYIKKLVNEDSDKMRTLDEIFAPVRKEFEEQGVTEEELDDLIYQARREVYAEKKARENR